jgi:membrane protein
VALFGSAYAALGVNLLIKLWGLPPWLAPAAIWLTLACLLALVFRFAPSRKVAWIYVLPGAGLAAAAIIGLGYAFPYYTQLTNSLGGGHRFFATFFGLVAWVYFIAQAILGGAVFNRALKDVRQR